MKYLLFVFAKHTKSQDRFVEILAEDITTVSDCDDVTYYYGPESVIYSFSTQESLINLKDFFDMLLGSIGVVYFMIPFETDKMSYWLSPEIEKTLLNTDKSSEKFVLSEENINRVQKLLFGDPVSEKEVTPKTKVFKLDDLLDKISESGYESLTSDEKKMLNEYSKK